MISSYTKNSEIEKSLIPKIKEENEKEEKKNCEIKLEEKEEKRIEIIDFHREKKSIENRFL